MNNGMQQGIEALASTLSPDNMWNVFFAMIPIVAIASLFSFGIYILYCYLTLPQKSSYEEFLEKYGFEDITDEEYEEAERQLYHDYPEFLEENDDLPPEYYDEREDDFYDEDGGYYKDGAYWESKGEYLDYYKEVHGHYPHEEDD